MKWIYLLALAMASIETNATPYESIRVYHDSQRGVTCWILNNTAISCLPERLLSSQPSKSKVEPSNREKADQRKFDNGNIPAEAPVRRPDQDRFLL